MEEMDNTAMVQKSGGARLKKGGKKPLIVIGILLAVLCAAYLGLCAYAGSLEVFYPNTTINDVDVAGCTVAEAAERLWGLIQCICNGEQVHAERVGHRQGRQFPAGEYKVPQ